MKKLIYIICLLLVIGCARTNQTTDFSYGNGKLNEINYRYGTDMQSYPANLSKIDLMMGELAQLKNLKLGNGQEPFEMIVGFRILSLEAQKLYISGQKYGDWGTTVNGFGCKRRPLIIESASLRRKSSSKGFDAAEELERFVNDYPKEASSINMSNKSVLFYNATFYEILNEAEADIHTINYFCPENITLDLYREDFRKNTNLSEDYINSLNYDKAAVIWEHEIGAG